MNVFIHLPIQAVVTCVILWSFSFILPLPCCFAWVPPHGVWSRWVDFTLCPAPKTPNFAKFTRSVSEFCGLSELFFVPLAPGGVPWMEVVCHGWVLLLAPKFTSFKALCPTLHIFLSHWTIAWVNCMNLPVKFWLCQGFTQRSM